MGKDYEGSERENNDTTMTRGDQSDEVVTELQDFPFITKMRDDKNVMKLEHSKNFTKTGHNSKVRQTSEKLSSSP